MELSINGKKRLVASESSEMLLWVLRDELGLTGTKFGCGIGICGSCTVHIDGQAVRSCVTPTAAAEGKDILTVEGLVGEEGLHPIQEAFIAAQVPQCAWCMNGQMMTALSFIEASEDITETRILDAMAANYCRCGCYARIKLAVADAAERMGKPVLSAGEES